MVRDVPGVDISFQTLTFHLPAPFPAALEREDTRDRLVHRHQGTFSSNLDRIVQDQPSLTSNC